MAIDELAKPQGTWCPHCKPGRGCSLYGAHPASCQSFQCGWLANLDMPDEVRPDRSKVVLDIDSDGNRVIARCDPGHPMAWQREPIHAQLRRWSALGWERGQMVLAMTNRRLWLIAPKEDVYVGEIDPNSPFAIAERHDGSISVTIMPVVTLQTPILGS